MALIERVLRQPRTRSERVRQRRAQREDAADPLGVSRPVKRRKRRKVRRRYDLSFSLGAGVEARLPSLPRARLGTRWISLIMIIVTSWSIYRAYGLEKYQIGKAQINGALNFTPTQVRSIADVDDLPIFAIDPGEIERRLQAFPEIASARVQVIWPNQLTIKVVERQPVLIWDDGGETWWLSEEGIAFLMAESSKILVQVHSPEPVLDIQEDPLVPALSSEVIQGALALSSAFNHARVLSYNPAHGFGIQDPQGWMVYFGTQGDMPAKVELYEKIAEQIKIRGYPASFVSVEDITAAYYR